MRQITPMRSLIESNPWGKLRDRLAFGLIGVEIKFYIIHAHASIVFVLPSVIAKLSTLDIKLPYLLTLHVNGPTL